MTMTYSQAIEFMQSTRHLGSVPGLSRLQRLLSLLGHPERRCRFLHVAGTNGKGSVCAMLASILQQAGYRTGQFTSPYLHSVREQICLNGEKIPKEDYARLAEKLADCGLPAKSLPTEFELTAALAFLYFAEQKCDFVVLEAGMGGTLDATNVIPPPLVAILTRIGLDHTAYLGDTLSQIATHKAGIIKPGCQVVCYPQQESVQRVIDNVCRHQKVPYSIPSFSQLQVKEQSLSGQVFSYGSSGPYQLPLLGDHQLHNACLVLETVRCLRLQGYAISEQAVSQGLSEVRWPARMEVLCRQPLFFLDGGHNMEGVQSAIGTLHALAPNSSFIFLTGVMKDKAYEQMFACMAPLASHFVGVQPQNPRALPLAQLGPALFQTGKPYTLCNTVEQGAALCLKMAQETGNAVCALGSLYMADDIRTAVFDFLTKTESDR